jgi:hypothetical protein
MEIMKLILSMVVDISLSAYGAGKYWLPEKSGVCFATLNLIISEDGKRLLKQRWLWI